MKVKLLFLLKLLLFSLVLFAFQGWIEKGYKLILLLICSLLLPPEQNAVRLEYASYVWMIPFLALMLATPRITVTRRISVILIGLVVFISIDIASILAWGRFPHSQSTAAHVISSQVWKTTGQWILPLLLWFIAIHRDIGELFSSSPKRREEFLPNRCPICGEKKKGVLDHIKDVHGEKLLTSRIVKEWKKLRL